jgi:hypothetical protein
MPLITVEQAVEALCASAQYPINRGAYILLVDAENAIRALQPAEPTAEAVERVQEACLRGCNDWLASGKPLGEKWHTVARAAIAAMRGGR